MKNASIFILIEGFLCLHIMQIQMKQFYNKPINKLIQYIYIYIIKNKKIVILRKGNKKLAFTFLRSFSIFVGVQQRVHFPSSEASNANTKRRL